MQVVGGRKGGGAGRGAGDCILPQEQEAMPYAAWAARVGMRAGSGLRHPIRAWFRSAEAGEDTQARLQVTTRAQGQHTTASRATLDSSAP